MDGQQQQTDAWCWKPLMGDAKCWTYLIPMLYQLVIYPPLLVASFLQFNSIGEFVMHNGTLFPLLGVDGDNEPLDTAEDERLFPLRLILYIFFGHMIRDGVMELSLPKLRWELLAHHVFACTAVLVVLCSPTSTVAAVCGIVALEVGSFTWSMWMVDSWIRALPTACPPWPRCATLPVYICGGERFVGRLYVITFTISNIAGAVMLGLSIWMALREGHTGFALFYTTGYVLLILRQLEVCEFARGKVQQPQYDELREADRPSSNRDSSVGADETAQMLAVPYSGADQTARV